jgi:putative nucleotidyltransferase with HDIG domain
MQTAAVAGLLGDRLGRPSTGSEFTAGLLHDIGKVVMAQEMPDQITRSLDLAESEGMSATDAETRVFGTTHADVGGWLAESWGLPQRLVEAITYHHRPMSALMATPASRDPALSAIVFLANVVAQPVDDERVCNMPVDPKTLGTVQRLVELEYPGMDADRLAGMLDGISASLDRAELFRANVETAEPRGDQQ